LSAENQNLFTILILLLLVLRHPGRQQHSPILVTSTSLDVTTRYNLTFLKIFSDNLCLYTIFFFILCISFGKITL